MKSDIHPEYMETIVTCSCGETFKTRSTKPEIRLEICSKCHPFFTGKQKLVDTGGRVQRFQDRYGYEIEEEEKRRVEQAQTEELIPEEKDEMEEKDKQEE